MRMSILLLAAGIWSISISAQAGTILYQQDFETLNEPFSLNIYGYDNLSQQPVNDLYGNQPSGSTFLQAFTVETLQVTGGTAFGGAGYIDASGKGGNYSLSMLANLQNDLLGLSFNVGSYQYLNFMMDFSSIGVTGFAGPSQSAGPTDVPKFSISLLDGNSLSGSLLDSIIVTGTASDPNVFDWTNTKVGLDASGNTNGEVTLVLDLLEGKYAAMDNFVVSSSNTQLDFSVPEPSVLALLGAGLVGIGFAKRRRLLRSPH